MMALTLDQVSQLADVALDAIDLLDELTADMMFPPRKPARRLRELEEAIGALDDVIRSAHKVRGRIAKES